MNEQLRRDAEAIVRSAVAAVLPDRAVERALQGMEFPGRVFLVAAGKAAWQMSRAAVDCLRRPLDGGRLCDQVWPCAGVNRGGRMH